MTLRIGFRSAIFILLAGLFLRTAVFAESCEKVVQTLNMRLSPGIDVPELVEVLRSLNKTNFINGKERWEYSQVGIFVCDEI
jgi:hypothetical protein